MVISLYKNMPSFKGFNIFPGSKGDEDKKPDTKGIEVEEGEFDDKITMDGETGVNMPNDWESDNKKAA